jgi:hypothetical protein
MNRLRHGCPLYPTSMLFRKSQAIQHATLSYKTQLQPLCGSPSLSIVQLTFVRHHQTGKHDVSLFFEYIRFSVPLCVIY